jgi:hypothetical protein
MKMSPRTGLICVSSLIIIGASALTASAQTITLPKLGTCGNDCIVKATQAWADAAAKCDGLSGKELERCGQNAEAVFQQTLSDCRRKENCPPVHRRKR